LITVNDHKASIKEIAVAVGNIKRGGSPLPLLCQGTLEEAKEKIEALKGTEINFLEHINL
jgi:hypothetical protein